MTAVKEAIEASVRYAIMDHTAQCPAFQSQGKISRVYTELFNGDDGEHGFIAEYRRDQEKMAFIHGAAKAWSWIFGVFFSALITILGFAVHEFLPAAKAIMKDYYLRHPDALVQPKKSISVPPDEVYTVRMERPSEHAKAGK